MTIERYPAVRVSEGVLPPGKHLFVPLEWVDRPDKGGWWWLVGGVFNCPVEVEDRYFKHTDYDVQIPVNNVVDGARWLWLGEVVQAAEREAKG